MASAGAIFAVHATALGSAGKAAPVSASAISSPAGFSVFTKTDVAKPDERVASIATDLGATPVDLERFEVLAGDLGPFRSRLISFPAMSGRNVCYSFLDPRPRCRERVAALVRT